MGGAASKAPTTDAGWKEVVRKSKKLSVSVPSKAIGRVIGLGGSNINAIRELSGAHIEVESKGQGDRTILIKGSAHATRLANQWISAIIASPDKDLADIVGRAQYKQLSAATITKAAVKTQAAAAADKHTYIAKKKPLPGFNNPLNKLEIGVKPKGQALKKVPLGICIFVCEAYLEILMLCVR